MNEIKKYSKAERDHLRRNLLYAGRYWPGDMQQNYRPQLDAAISKLHHMTFEAAGTATNGKIFIKRLCDEPQSIE